MPPFDPALFKDVFDFVLVSPPPGGSGEGSGLSFPEGTRRFWADSDPDLVGNTFSAVVTALDLLTSGPHPGVVPTNLSR